VNTLEGRERRIPNASVCFPKTKCSRWNVCPLKEFRKKGVQIKQKHNISNLTKKNTEIREPFSNGRADRESDARGLYFLQKLFSLPPVVADVLNWCENYFLVCGLCFVVVVQERNAKGGKESNDKGTGKGEPVHIAGIYLIYSEGRQNCLCSSFRKDEASVSVV
jgi:hypothetical protein